MISQYSQRLIRKNHRKSLPRKILYLDTETEGIKEGLVERHRMKMAWSCYYERRPEGVKDTEQWLFWDSYEAFMKYIASLCHRKTTLYIFAHNAFFDLQASLFFYYFPKWGWALNFVYEAGTSYILVIRKNKATIKVLSTTNYFNTSVEALGKMFDLPKLSVNFETVSKEDLSRYCRRDVEIIKKAMEYYFAFITEHDLGRFSLTRASQSLAAYRHRFMNERIYVHDNKDASKLEKKAYMGGRVECFSFGEQTGGPFVSLDINSMYPYVMKTKPVPCRLLSYRTHPPLEVLENDLKTRCVVANCLIKTDTPRYAVRHHNKIIFPTGSFETALTTDDLKTALDHDEIKGIFEYASYEKAYLFGDYVDYFYALRQQFSEQGQLILKELCKNFLNYLYGKFAQYKPIQEIEEDTDGKEYYRLETISLVTGEKEIEYKLFNTRITQSGKQIAGNSLVAIAAHITAYARALLWSIIDEIGTESVLYCDTDSIKIRKKDLSSITYPIDNVVLGALKIEGITKKLIIKGAKSYETDTERKLKGVPKRAVQLDEHTFKYSMFPHQVTHLREEVNDAFLIKQIVKVVKNDYTKGVVLPDARIRPFVMSWTPGGDATCL